jgi:hypothetical protein
MKGLCFKNSSLFQGVLHYIQQHLVLLQIKHMFKENSSYKKVFIWTEDSLSLSTVKEESTTGKLTI